MNSNESTLKKFNTNLECFLVDLSKIFPDHNNNIRIFKEKFTLLTQVNKRKVLDIFIMHVYPHKDEILSKNDDFFLSMYEKNGDKLSESDPMFESLNLGELWRRDSLEDKHREMIWTYFKVLCVLSERYLISYVKN